MPFFLFHPTASTESPSLSLHDALPISALTLRMRYDDGFIAYINGRLVANDNAPDPGIARWTNNALANRDRKSTRLNSSHLVISYAVFCLKKKNHDISIN